MVDQVEKKLRCLLQENPPLARRLPGPADIPLGARQNFGGRTQTLGADRLQEIEGLDRFASANGVLGDLDDRSDARRHQNAFPHPIVTRPERAPQFGMQLIFSDSAFHEIGRNSLIGLVTQRQ